MNWEHIFIDKLLTKYEQSKKFWDAKVASRKINLSFTMDKVREYHFGTPQDRLDIKQAVLRLAGMELIHVVWKKNEIGNLIEEIVLQVDNANECYNFIGRRSKLDELTEFTSLLTNYSKGLAALGLENVLKDWIHHVGAKKRIPSIFPRNSGTRNYVIRALAGMAALEDDMDERMFSIAVFGNSKSFLGNVKAGVARILRAHAAIDSDSTDSEVLEVYGILETGSDFHIAGDIIFRLPDGKLDISAVTEGIGLHPPTVKVAEIAEVHAEVMLSVENLAIFRECTRRRLYPNVLLVYSGGFYSRRKIELLKRIRAAMHQAFSQPRFFHWGDIDLGGLRIFRHLKSNAIPELRPFMMSPEVLEQYQSFCTPVDTEYVSKVQSLINDNDLHDLKPTIMAFAEKKVRLEQEVILGLRVEALPLTI